MWNSGGLVADEVRGVSACSLLTAVAVGLVPSLGASRIDLSRRLRDSHSFWRIVPGLLLIAATGLFGVLFFSVNGRTREMAIRLTVGARTAGVLRLVLTEGLPVSVVGVAMGVLGALALTRFLTSFLYAVQAFDAVTCLAAAVTLLLTVSVAIMFRHSGRRGWIRLRRFGMTDLLRSIRQAKETAKFSLWPGPVPFRVLSGFPIGLYETSGRYGE